MISYIAAAFSEILIQFFLKNDTCSPPWHMVSTHNLLSHLKMYFLILSNVALWSSIGLCLLEKNVLTL